MGQQLLTVPGYDGRRAVVAAGAVKAGAQPCELAWRMVFLNSPRAAYVHDVNLPVDGGNSAAV